MLDLIDPSNIIPSKIITTKAKVSHQMLGLRDLKEERITDGQRVACPLRDCTRSVPRRQREQPLRQDQFACQDHAIYISPSTFEYVRYQDNLLWTNPEDTRLLEGLLKVKRESRLAREKSEDAVTWNVLRALENVGPLESWVAHTTGRTPGRLQLAYWSCDPVTLRDHKALADARGAFNEQAHRGSEPDVIAFGPSALIFIEAKLMSRNQTRPSEPQAAEQRYTQGAGEWYPSVVKSDFREVAIDHQFYELLRLWLLGTWAANRTDVPFYLINLTADQRERDIEMRFGRHIKESPERSFRRATWEGVLKHLQSSAPTHVVTGRLEDYMRQKTTGYDSAGRIQRAFSMS